MLWAVNNGFVGVTATYRLTPQSPHPEPPLRLRPSGHA
jgi:hypothetical protein